MYRTYLLIAVAWWRDEGLGLPDSKSAPVNVKLARRQSDM
jgi:hypothetical protein